MPTASQEVLPTHCIDGAVFSLQPGPGAWQTQGENDNFGFGHGHESNLDDPKFAPYLAALAADPNVFSEMREVAIVANTFGIRDPRRSGAGACGDAFVRAITFGAEAGFVFRVEFDAASDLGVFETQFKPSHERPFDLDDAARARMSAFLVGRAKLSVIAVQAGADPATVAALAAATKCATDQLAACDQLAEALRAHVAGYAAQMREAYPFPSAPAPAGQFSGVPGWVVRSVSTAPYDIVP